jgi:ABC-type glycerol-3-phosphate transport system permease component
LPAFRHLDATRFFYRHCPVDDPAIVTVRQLSVLAAQHHQHVLPCIRAQPVHIFAPPFHGLPARAEERVELDGCDRPIFLQVFLPNAQPVLATSGILSFMWVWGDWFNPLIFLSDFNTTLAVKISNAYVTPQGQLLTPVILAACVLYVLVPVAVFFVGQKYILQGIVTSGLKG